MTAMCILYVSCLILFYRQNKHLHQDRNLYNLLQSVLQELLLIQQQVYVHMLLLRAKCCSRNSFSCACCNFLWTLGVPKKLLIASTWVITRNNFFTFCGMSFGPTHSQVCPIAFWVGLRIYFYGMSSVLDISNLGHYSFPVH